MSGLPAEQGLTTAEADRLRLEWGRNEIPEKITPWYVILGKQFMGPMPAMIGAAAILSLVIAVLTDGGPWPDFGICTFMLLVNAVLGFREQLHANNAAAALKEKVMPEVSVKRDGTNQMMDARLLVPGDVVFLKAGQTVPADSKWLSGDPMGIDNAALNGESRIDKVWAGKTNLWSGASVKTGGGSNCLVQKTGTNTMIGEAALAMSEGRPGKAMFQQTVESLVRCVIAVALVMVAVILGVQLGVRDHDVLETLLACVSLLIGSVPVALPVVLTVTLALGSAKMSEEGAIVTNLTSLQEVAVMKILCSDKTGTLTTAKMTVYPDRIWPGAADFSQDEVLTYAGLACNPDNVEDPIDSGVLRACREHFDAKGGEGEWDRRMEQWERARFIGFDPSTKRVCGFYQNTKSGKCYQIGKGLLGKVLDADRSDGDVIMAGEGNYWQCENLEAVTAQAKVQDKLLASDAFKTISVSVRIGTAFETNAEGQTTLVGASSLPMRFAGILPMRDPPRADTAPTVRNIRTAGVEVKMITGDHHDIAVKTSEQINLGSAIHARDKLYLDFPECKVCDDALIEEADGFAQVVPTDKFNVIKSLQGKGYIVGMTGDGVNDAAALSAANCGIAVKGAVDAARAASDILLTEGGLSPIYSAIFESRCIFQRLRSYVIYRIGHSIHVVATLSILILGFDYVLDPLYVILMALFNDLAITMIGYDNAIPTTGPSVPRTLTMLVLAFVAGITQSASTIFLFYFGQHILMKDTGATTDIAPADHGNFHWMDGSGHGDYYISTVLYLQMSTTAGLLMFTTRTRKLLFLGNPPDWRLVVAVAGAFLLTLFMSKLNTLPPGEPTSIEWEDIGIIYAYNLGVAVLIEAGKIAVIYALPEDPTDRDICAAEQGLAQNVSLDNDNETAPLLNEQGMAGSGVGSNLRPKGSAKRQGSLRASLTGDHRHVARDPREAGDVMRR